jgi:hypothetical protein
VRPPPLSTPRRRSPPCRTASARSHVMVTVPSPTRARVAVLARTPPWQRRSAGASSSRASAGASAAIAGLPRASHPCRGGAGGPARATRRAGSRRATSTPPVARRERAYRIRVEAAERLRAQPSVRHPPRDRRGALPDEDRQLHQGAPPRRARRGQPVRLRGVGPGGRRRRPGRLRGRPDGRRRPAHESPGRTRLRPRRPRLAPDDDAAPAGARQRRGGSGDGRALLAGAPARRPLRGVRLRSTGRRGRRRLSRPSPTSAVPRRSRARSPPPRSSAPPRRAAWRGRSSPSCC